MESFSLLVLDSRAIILHNSLSHHSSFCSSPNFFVCVPSQSDMHILAYLISIEHVNGKHWRSTKKQEKRRISRCSTSGTVMGVY